ncbi:williams-Beuren syndrome DDT (WSD), d-TOX E motif domain-containing protein [Ditylenchus destructor]|nr:williams-Beuren syndrome DDT (WSD), d-TOX E motif domain-containing protein [Ditylenchus destructor]
MDQLHEDFLRRAGKIIHHSSKDVSVLCDKIKSLLNDNFFKGEKVILDNSRDLPGTIADVISNRSSPSNKENGVFYTVQTSHGTMPKVSEARIRRAMSIDDSSIHDFIQRWAHQKGQLWILDEELRRKLDIRDQFHPMFAGQFASPASSPKSQPKVKSIKTPVGTLHIPQNYGIRTDPKKRNSIDSDESFQKYNKKSDKALSDMQTNDISVVAEKTPSCKKVKASSKTPILDNHNNSLKKKSGPPEVIDLITDSNSESTADLDSNSECGVQIQSLKEGPSADISDGDETMLRHLKFPKVRVPVRRIDSPAVLISSIKSEKKPKHKKLPQEGGVASTSTDPVQPKARKRKPKEDGMPKKKREKKSDVQTENKDGEKKKRKKKVQEAGAVATDENAAGPSSNVQTPTARMSTGGSKKQKMLTKYFSPVSNGSVINGVTQMSEEERQRKLIRIYSLRMERALLTCEKTNVLKVLKEMTKLQEQTVDGLPNEFIKYIVKREIATIKNTEAMKNMTTEQKKEYRKENISKTEGNKRFEKLWNRLMSGREDMITELKPFPEFPPVEFPEYMTLPRFQRCLVITEFLHIFRDFLDAKTIYSADDLMLALVSPKNGFTQCIGNILKTFIFFLLQDGYMADCDTVQKFAKRCDNTSGVDGISKLVQLIGNELRVNVENGHFEVLHDKILAALQELNDCANFYDIRREHQLIILEMFLEEMIETDSFRNHLVSSKILHAKAVEDKKEIENSITELEQEIAKIPVIGLEYDIGLLTRRQTAELHENEKVKKNKEAELEELRESLNEQLNCIREAEVIDKYARVDPLGYDRYHRKYWFFGDSPNTGIFMEQDEIIPEGGRNQLPFMEKLEENLYGRLLFNEEREEEWRIIKTQKLFDAFLNCLSAKGVRESELLRNIQLKRDAILKSLVQEEPDDKENTETDVTAKDS